MNAPPPSQQVNDQWEAWPEQDGEAVGNNGMAVINNLADMIVADVVANELLQHPEEQADLFNIQSS